MRRKPYLDERDRDIFEADLAEEAANVAAYERWLERAPLKPDLRDDGYDENDPYDRLTSEGGYLDDAT